VQTVEQFFEEQCDLFARNDLAPMSLRFAMPTAIYFNEQIMVFKNPKAIQSLLSVKRTALRHAHYARTSFRIIAQSIKPRKHLSVWVEFRHFTADNSLITSSTSRYFCVRQAGAHLLIQLIEYLQTPQLDLSMVKTDPLFDVDYHSTVAPV
jgi:hypothetical protein